MKENKREEREMKNDVRMKWEGKVMRKKEEGYHKGNK
jgi:hypothetical protein